MFRLQRRPPRSHSRSAVQPALRVALIPAVLAHEALAGVASSVQVAAWVCARTLLSFDLGHHLDDSYCLPGNPGNSPAVLAVRHPRFIAQVAAVEQRSASMSTESSRAGSSAL
jgi:hypothetical protein